MQTGKEKATFTGRFALSPDGKTLATTGRDGSIRLWDVGTGKVRATLKGHKGSVFALAFSPDGKVLASGPYAGGIEGSKGDYAIKLWDVESGKETAALSGHVKGIYSLTFAPDGKTLVAADFTGVMKLWDVARARVKATLGKVKDGAKLRGTPVGYWAIAPDLTDKGRPSQAPPRFSLRQDPARRSCDR